MGGMISGILGGGESAGQEAQMAALKQAQDNIQAYRPEAMQARLNALSSMSTAYQGANNALETMYGGSAAMGPQGLGKLNMKFKPSSEGGRLMGHDLPSQASGPEMGPIGGPGGRPRQGPPQLGQGDGWQDDAAMMVDPLGIFRGMF